MGVLLLVGAWRHVGAVLGSRDPRSDAWALARLTGVPPVLWLGSFVLALGLASWLAAAELLGVKSGREVRDRTSAFGQLVDRYHSPVVETLDHCLDR